MRALKRKLIIFAKAPIAGHAKSRMIPLLGAVGAAQLHREITRWLLSKLSRSVEKGADEKADYELELWAASDIEHPFFKECADEFGITLKLQQGDDLGERQFLAMQSALAENDHVVIVGSDVVSLKKNDIQEAFGTLEQGDDLVISPAEDGGYGLIGSSKIERGVFNGIVWGAEQVYEEMVNNLNRLDYRWQRLSEVWDLDRPDDLIRLRSYPELPTGISDLLNQDMCE